MQIIRKHICFLAYPGPRPKTYDQDTNTWNRHMFIECHNTYFGIRKIQNWFRYETFIHLFEFKVFQHEERETQFLQQTRSTFRRPLGEAKNRLPSSRLLFQIPQILSASGMTSFTSPVLFPIWGFYCDISDCHIRPARAWTPALNMCT